MCVEYFLIHAATLSAFYSTNLEISHNTAISMSCVLWFGYFLLSSYSIAGYYHRFPPSVLHLQFLIFSFSSLVPHLQFLIFHSSSSVPHLPFLIFRSSSSVPHLQLLIFSSSWGSRNIALGFRVKVGVVPTGWWNSLVKTPLLENALVLGVKIGVVRILLVLQDRPLFSYINGKLSSIPFSSYGWTKIGLEK